MKKFYFFLLLGLMFSANISAQTEIDSIVVYDWDGSPLGEDGTLYLGVGETSTLQFAIYPSDINLDTVSIVVSADLPCEGSTPDDSPVTIDGRNITGTKAGRCALYVCADEQSTVMVPLVVSYVASGSLYPDGATGGQVYFSLNSKGTLQFWAGELDKNKPVPSDSIYEIPTYDSASEAPWYKWRKDIKEIILDNLDNIGSYAFNNLTNIRYVKFPSDIQYLGDFVFSGCANLKTLEVARWGGYAEPDITYTSGTALIISEANPDDPTRPELVLVDSEDEGALDYYRSADSEWGLCGRVIAAGGSLDGESAPQYTLTPSETTGSLQLVLDHNGSSEEDAVLPDKKEADPPYPWEELGDLVEDLRIHDRVRYIGQGVFSTLTNLQTIQFDQRTAPVDSIHLMAFSSEITPWKFALGDPQDGPILPPKITGVANTSEALQSWIHFAQNTVLYVPDSTFIYNNKEVRSIDLYRADPVWGQVFNRLTDRTVDTVTHTDDVILKWLPLENATCYRLIIHKPGCDECLDTLDIPATGVQGLVDWSQIPSNDSPAGAPHRIIRIKKEDEHGGMTLTISLQQGSGTAHIIDISVAVSGMEKDQEYAFSREVFKINGADGVLAKAGKFKLEAPTYTVTFVDKDGNTLKTEVIKEGNAATAPSAPSVTGYHFTGWDKAFDNVTSDLTVKAQYAINVYTVTFTDKDGNTLKTESVEHGKGATAPSAPSVTGYHFTGWDKAFDNVTSDLTVKAQYAINVYTVTFTDKDGNTLKTESVEHGKAATAPSAPSVTGYHFTGWDKAFDNVTSDLTVKAQYAINVYTVTFTDKDGNTLKTESVEHGKGATAPSAPSVTGYHFTGWDKDFSNITANLTVKAQYAINVYTVTFVDKDGNTLKTESVEHGKDATAPSAPSVTGYHFTGWDKAFDNVTSDLTVKAQYAINVYTVTFTDKDGNTLKTESVEHGKGATAPSAPSVTGYHFTGWDKAFDNVTSDLTVKAQYAINVYTVTFTDKDGNTLKTESVEHGKGATAPSAPSVTGYHFTGWDKAFDNVTSDLTVKAQYAINTYTVTFYDKDNNVLSTQTVNWNEAAVAPETPVWEGHTFTGWSAEFDHVKSDLHIKPIYDVQTYTVTFVGFGGTELKKENVEYGKAATAPDAPVVTGYHFTGWDKDFSNIAGDLTVTAQYAINVYTVTFVDSSDKTIKTEKVEHGSAATAPDAPSVEGYHFIGWDKAFDIVTSDLTVKAQYAINVYTVTFTDKDGNTLKTESVEHGKGATAPSAPSVTGYHFTGWDKKFDNVTSDLTVKAQYAINVYTVTFVGFGGTALKTENVEYGNAAIAPDAPEVEGYTFLGWDKGFAYITSDLTVTAQYLINLYSVTFIGFDGRILWSEQVEHGHAATAPDAPEIEGYAFIGWDTDFSNVTSNLTITAIYEKLPDYTPTNLSALVETLDNDTRITLSWDKVDGAASYELLLLLGDEELYAGNTFGLNTISLTLSDILQIVSIAPGTYLLDWMVRSTDAEGQPLSEWAKGETFEITIQDPGQGIGDIPSEGECVHKEMRNGLLYIIRNGQTYDSNGKQVH